MIKSHRLAGVTQRLECNLAKVEVEGSNPFSRSTMGSFVGLNVLFN